MCIFQGRKSDRNTNPARNKRHQYSYKNDLTVLSIISIHSVSSASLMTSGGANRTISPCVGFAKSPLSRIRLHNSSAQNGSRITIAFNKPFPRTVFTISSGSLFNSSRRTIPFLTSQKTWIDMLDQSWKFLVVYRGNQTLKIVFFGQKIEILTENFNQKSKSWLTK